MRKLLVPLALLVPAGCGGGNGGGGSLISPIVGTWAVKSIQAPNAAAQTCPTTVTVGGGNFTCRAGETQVFGADGSFTDVAASLQGTYTVNGSALTINIPGMGTMSSFVGLGGTTLTESTANSAGTVVTTLQKQ